MKIVETARGRQRRVFQVKFQGLQDATYKEAKEAGAKKRAATGRKVEKVRIYPVEAKELGSKGLDPEDREAEPTTTEPSSEPGGDTCLDRYRRDASNMLAARTKDISVAIERNSFDMAEFKEFAQEMHTVAMLSHEIGKLGTW